jgi:hypothetical protein
MPADEILLTSLPIAWRLQWESPGWHSRPLQSSGARHARSQLRGSGGISPRFPNISLRAKMIDGTAAEKTAAGTKGEIHF